jgi:hypothetical protein
VFDIVMSKKEYDSTFEASELEGESIIPDHTALESFERKFFLQYISRFGGAKFVTDMEKKKRILHFLCRLCVGITGGAALIVPIFTMILVPSKVGALLTISISVIAVAVGMVSFMRDAQNKDIIAATAAYAAVLVVFLGPGTTTT